MTYKLEASKIDNTWKPGPIYPKENPQEPSFVTKNVKVNNSMNSLGVYNEKISSFQVYQQSASAQNVDIM